MKEAHGNFSPRFDHSGVKENKKRKRGEGKLEKRLEKKGLIRGRKDVERAESCKGNR